MTKHRCGTCRFYQEASFASSGWCHHPQRRTNSDILIMVRKNELACRDEWARDLWEARGGNSVSDAAPIAIPLPSVPVLPATESDIAAIIRSDTVVSASITSDVMLSEIGGAVPEPPAPVAEWHSASSRDVGSANSQDYGNEPAPVVACEAEDIVRLDVESPSFDGVALAPQSDPAVAGVPDTHSWSPEATFDEREEQQADTEAARTYAETAHSDARWAEDDSAISGLPALHSSGESDEDREHWTSGGGNDVAYNNTGQPGRPPQRRSFRISDLLPWRQPSAQDRDGVQHRPERYAQTERSIEDNLAPVAAGASQAGPGHDSEIASTEVLTSAPWDFTVALQDDPAASLAVETTPTERAADDETETLSPSYRASVRSGGLHLGLTADHATELAGDPAFATPSWFDQDDLSDDEALTAVASAASETPVTDLIPASLDPVDAMRDPASVLALLPPRTDTGPRNCRRCRDFRPGEDGERGSCVNQWAWGARTVVAGNDLSPCASGYGDWWVARDDLWFDLSDISAHGLVTPMLDAFVPTHRPEESARRRR